MTEHTRLQKFRSILSVVCPICFSHAAQMLDQPGFEAPAVQAMVYVCVTTVDEAAAQVSSSCILHFEQAWQQRLTLSLSSSVLSCRRSSASMVLYPAVSCTRLYVCYLPSTSSLVTFTDSLALLQVHWLHSPVPDWRCQRADHGLASSAHHQGHRYVEHQHAQCMEFWLQLLRCLLDCHGHIHSR